MKFGSKIPDKTPESPGPASYSLNYSFLKCASIALTIGKAKRQINQEIKVGNINPGPGRYQVEHHRTIAEATQNNYYGPRTMNN